MTAEMSVQFTLALAYKKNTLFLYPSAETGRQGKLKFY